MLVVSSGENKVPGRRDKINLDFFFYRQDQLLELFDKIDSPTAIALDAISLPNEDVNVIEIENLWKRYFLVKALKDISLRVDPGRVVGVLGENGSGKSTLFKTLAGVVRPSQGRVRVLGQPVGVETRRHTAYLPEVSPFYAWMRVAEQLDFLSHFYADWDSDKCADLLNFMKLDRDRRVGTLSNGQKGRLKLVAGFSRPSRLVLMDEPFGGIDPPSRKRILEVLLREFRLGEQTILISTHLVEEVEEFIEDVLFMREGEIALRGHVETLRQERRQSLSEMFEEVVL